MESWAEVKPGAVITVHPSYRRSGYKIRVESVDPAITPESRARMVRGARLTMAGAPSRRRGRRDDRGRLQPQTSFYVFDTDVAEIA